MNKLYLTCGILAVLIALCALFLMFQPMFFPIMEYTDKNPIYIHPDNPPEDTSKDTETTAPDDPQENPPVEIPYECPTELTALMEQNSDIYAWIRIPGTNINYPIVQNQLSDNFYLRRGIDKQYSIAGSIMTDHQYNGRTFDDPVTVIYGHCMESGIMFGTLQSVYSGDDSMKENGVIEIYLSDKKLEYNVFAAVPYDSRNILFNYDFHDERIYSTFFRSIFSTRSLNANFKYDCAPEYGDKVIILSTCLWGDCTCRYLVMAKLKA